MPTATIHSPTTDWLPGEDLPYVMRLAGTQAVAVSVPAEWVIRDKSGTIAFRPPAVRWLDRLRALYSRVAQAPTPGFIRALRQAMKLTQEQMANQLGVSKMTVSRWERGSMKPNAESIKAMLKLRRRALQRGLAVDGAP